MTMMTRAVTVTMLIAALALPACSNLAVGQALAKPSTTADAAPFDPAHPQASPYDVGADAMAAVDTALSRAAARNARTIVVIGANWCHDSRALAGWLQSPELAPAIAGYELVFVDAGKPQAQQWHNPEVNQRFGIETQQGTPMVMVLSSEGALLNSEVDAQGWRNAASRSSQEIARYFAQFPAHVVAEKNAARQDTAE